jgi:hypothetical protein
MAPRERDDLDARSLLGQHEFAAREVGRRRRSETG